MIAIEVAQLITDQSTKNGDFWHISEALIEAKKFNRAAEVAKLIPNESMQELALRKIKDILMGSWC